MALPLRLACLGLILFSAGATHAASPSATSNIYCCQDPATGRRACGDTVPDQCRGHAYKILDRNGNVVREVGPPMTAEQKAQAAAEAQRKKEEEAAQREQRRKDQALLATYSSVQDIDQARSRSEADVGALMKQAEAKIDALRQKRKKFESEAEFYRNKTLPPEISKGMRDIDSEIKANNSVLEAKKAELEQIHTKYDEDKRRYLELSGGGSSATRSVR